MVGKSETTTYVNSEFRYLHADALGNIDTITDSHGAVLQRIAYSPFGTRRVTASNDPDYQAWTDRGFTGHEHLDGLGLIHMNARLYDPEIGRFLSPDTYIQAPHNSQNYNRYSYVLNNPLKYTDPSGHFFSSLLNLIEKIGSFLVSYAPTIAGIAVAAFLGPGATFLQAVMHGAAAGFVGGLVGSGSLRGALEGAFWGGITAGSARGIGHGFGGGSSPSPFGAGKWLVHGIAQGTISELRGGNFQSGFVGAVAGSVAGGASGRVMNSFGTSNLGISTAVTAVFGGLASKASGGSFEDGAVSAAFTYLFNDAAENLRLLGQGYNASDVRGGFDEYGDSLVYHPDHYDSSTASLLLLSGTGVVAGGAALGLVFLEGAATTTTVTSWASVGITADLAAGRWVMKGGATRWNYIKTGLWGPQYEKRVGFYMSKVPFNNSITGNVSSTSLQWPEGWEAIKGFLGQRVIK